MKLTVLSKRGKKAVIAIFRHGDFFGEGCLGAPSLRMSTATAVHVATITRVGKATIVRIIHEDPVFARLLIAHLLSRVVRIEEDFLDQLFNSSEKRLARTLLSLASFGTQSKPDTATLKVSQGTLAEMVGTTRSRVSFFMNRFRKLGLIDYNGSLHVHRALLTFLLREVVATPGSRTHCPASSPTNVVVCDFDQFRRKAWVTFVSLHLIE